MDTSCCIPSVSEAEHSFDIIISIEEEQRHYKMFNIFAFDSPTLNGIQEDQFTCKSSYYTRQWASICIADGFEFNSYLSSWAISFLRIKSTINSILIIRSPSRGAVSPINTSTEGHVFKSDAHLQCPMKTLLLVIWMPWRRISGADCDPWTANQFDSLSVNHISG